MAISAQEVNKLRKMTGAGMMDCKKALTESNGDFDKAIEVLRKKGQKISLSRADRETSEGSIFTKSSPDNSFSIMISFTCETDFVAKNKDFRDLGQSIADKAFEAKSKTIESLLQEKIGSLSIAECINELLGKIGEKLEIKHVESLTDDVVVPYIHANGKLGVLVALQGSGDKKSMEEGGKNVAMQVAAMNPVALNEDQVDSSVVEQELAIGKEIAVKEGKPAELAERISQGRLKKFFKENTLLNQAYVKDNKLSISQYLSSISKDVTVSQFKRISIS